MYAERGDVDRAREVAIELLRAYKTREPSVENGEILLHRAILHLQTSNEYSMQALGPIIECLSLCEQLHIFSIK